MNGDYSVWKDWMFWAMLCFYCDAQISWETAYLTWLGKVCCHECFLGVSA